MAFEGKVGLPCRSDDSIPGSSLDLYQPTALSCYW